jgi:ribosomal protein RSM22 (predicted rRNA methylase)
MANKIVPPATIEIETQPTAKLIEAAKLLNEILATISSPNVTALLNQPKKKDNEAKDLAEFALNELYGVVIILSDVVSDNMPPKKDSPNTN